MWSARITQDLRRKMLCSDWDIRYSTRLLRSYEPRTCKALFFSLLTDAIYAHQRYGKIVRVGAFSFTKKSTTKLLFYYSYILRTRLKFDKRKRKRKNARLESRLCFKTIPLLFVAWKIQFVRRRRLRIERGKSVKVHVDKK